MRRELPQGYSRAVPIGAGAFGTVLRARQDDLGRWVALKRIRKGDETARLEAQALAASPLPCLPTVHGIVSGRKADWISMEYVHGVSMREVPALGLDSADLARVASEFVKAVAVLHGSARAHGDLKPENAVLQPDGSVRLVDLGLSSHSSGSTRGGSAGYMAPEAGPGCDPRRADLWSVGVVLHELLVGIRPSATERAGGWKMLRSSAPDWVPLVDLLLKDDAARRPASAQELIPELPESGASDRAVSERLREHADRGLASRMVAEAARRIDARDPAEALWLLQSALELDPDQSEALALLPRVRMGNARRSRGWKAALAIAVAVVVLAIVGSAVSRSHEHRRHSVPAMEESSMERYRPDRIRQKRGASEVPLREGKDGTR